MEDLLYNLKRDAVSQRRRGCSVALSPEVVLALVKRIKESERQVDRLKRRLARHAR